MTGWTKACGERGAGDSRIRSGRCTTLLVAPLDESSADLIEFDGEVEGRLPLDLSFTGHTINVLKG